MSGSAKISIAYIMGPTQAISLDAALYELFPNETIVCQIFASADPGPNANTALVEMCRRILETSRHKYQFIENHEQFSSLATELVSHFFYAHDCVGNLTQTLAKAFPLAQRICLGDALGTVYDRAFHVDHLLLQARRPEEYPWFDKKIQHLKKLLFYRREIEDNKTIIPDLASLIIPVDQTGISLLGVKVRVPSKTTVLSHLHRMRSSFPEVQQFFKTVLDTAQGQPIYFLLMENHFECGTIDFDQEILMYKSMIEGYAQKGTTVVLKGHPAEQNNRYEALVKTLGNSYKLIDVPAQLRRIPFEIWDDVIPQIEVICSSYPTLSLAYLFDKKILNPQNPAFIRRWFGKHFESYLDGLMQYILPERNLNRWKGKGLLFRGPAHLKIPKNLF